MSKLQIISNNQPRFIISGFDLPKSAQKDFDYLGEEYNHQFVKYLGHYYDISEFMLLERNSDFKGWEGYDPDTYFSGTLIKLCEDGDSVIMGRYYS